MATIPLKRDQSEALKTYLEETMGMFFFLVSARADPSAATGCCAVNLEEARRSGDRVKTKHPAGLEATICAHDDRSSKTLDEFLCGYGRRDQRSTLKVNPSLKELADAFRAASNGNGAHPPQTGFIPELVSLVRCTFAQSRAIIVVADAEPLQEIARLLEPLCGGSDRPDFSQLRPGGLMLCQGNLQPVISKVEVWPAMRDSTASPPTMQPPAQAPAA